MIHSHHRCPRGRSRTLPHVALTTGATGSTSVFAIHLTLALAASQSFPMAPKGQASPALSAYVYIRNTSVTPHAPLMPAESVLKPRYFKDLISWTPTQNDNFKDLVVRAAFGSQKSMSSFQLYNRQLTMCRAQCPCTRGNPLLHSSTCGQRTSQRRTLPRASQI